MTIRIEFIKRRPGGRITVRPTIYDKREISLGRATDCDVHLADLRVGLHHANLTQVSPTKARIEANDDHRVRVDGSQIRRRDITLNEQSVIRIGPYQLTLAATEKAGELLITIELVEPPTPVGDNRDEKTVFGMRGYAPSKRATAWLLMATILAVFLALPISLHFRAKMPESVNSQKNAPHSVPEKLALATNQHWMAGAMSSSHANLTNDCRSCHVKPFTRVMDETCLSCHEELGDHAHQDKMTLATTGHGEGDQWLGTLRAGLDIPEGRCGSCHFEHNGPEGVIPKETSFCVDCHTDLDQRIEDTKLVNVSNFSKRHPEFSPTLVRNPQSTPVKFERISLVKHPKENNGLKFPHDFHLKDEEVIRKIATLPTPIRKKYGDVMECANCHEPDAAGALIKPIEMETHCADCHSLAFATGETSVRNLPHGQPAEVRRVLADFYLAQATTLLLGDSSTGILGQQLSAEARARRARLREQALENARRNTEDKIERVFSEDGVCQKCHTNQDPGSNSLPEIRPVHLSTNYFPMAKFSHKSHETGDLECTTCHQAETSSAAEDILMPSITACRDCHDDSTTRPTIASDCLTCHGFHNDNKDAPPMQPRKTRAAMTRWPR
ncbi:cytochrome c3 family protein [Hyphococcus lacteus]|uniref:Cytochrome c3 family protein n=1 Tax=Hyphococcus lacteus TaxID=3143536 RepID=A0ABV3Z712_9PROT